MSGSQSSSKRTPASNANARLDVLEKSVERLSDDFDAFKSGMFGRLDELTRAVTGITAGAGRVAWKEVATLVSILVIGAGCIGVYVELKLEVMRVQMENRDDRITDLEARVEEIDNYGSRRWTTQPANK
jgi:hypothetical protein